ncbi:MAG: hypothetical protein ACOWWM_16415 [Desulfobacterales bacterium]
MANRTREKPTRAKDPHSTVLMVDSRGEVRTVENFGRKMKLAIWLILLSLGLCGVMGFFYTRQTAENLQLRSRLDDLRRQLDDARAENELLMARVVIAEASAPRVEDGEPSAVVDAGGAETPIPAAAEPEGAAAEGPVAAVEASTAEALSVPEVDVGNFEVRYRADRSRLEVAYALRNVGEGRAEGRSVAVLTTDAEGDNQVVTLPRVWVENGIPNGRRGRRFSIRRFLRVTLDRQVEAEGVRIETAEVFVFSSSGELLTRKTFPVDLQLPGKPKAAVQPGAPAAESSGAVPVSADMDPVPVAAPPVGNARASEVLGGVESAGGSLALPNDGPKE